MGLTARDVLTIVLRVAYWLVLVLLAGFFLYSLLTEPANYWTGVGLIAVLSIIVLESAPRRNN
jgi:hypothetical protein